MKNRKILIALALVILAGAAWLLFERSPALSEKQTTKETSVTASPAPRVTPYTGPLPNVIPQQPYQGLGDSRWPIFWAKRAKDPDLEWKTPIEFYGKVVDQDNTPVAGVEVKMNWTDMSPKGTSEANRTTDTGGLFSITDIQGKNFGVISLAKEGYVAFRESNPNSFEYAGFWEPSYHIPDKGKPVLFRLRKKGEAAELARYGPTLFGVTPDGVPVIFDLATGRKNSGAGDVSVRMTRGEKSANKQFDWEVTLEAIGTGAGLAESKDEFMTEAPDAGYQSSWKFSQKSGAEKYQSEVQTKFFVKTAGGQFARIEVRVLPTYNDTAAVDLVSYFNSKAGDRNLEFDPSKVVKSP